MDKVIIMTKEEAIKILNDYAFFKWDSFGNVHFTFPIYDEVVFDGYENGVRTTYTFRHILQIAYGLNDKAN